jgi:hypothetical protein
MRFAVARLFVMVSGLFLLNLAIGNAGAAEQASAWSMIKTDYYHLYYRPAYEKDAKKVREFLDGGIEALKKEFHEFPVDQLLRVDCEIYLHDRSNDKASEHAVAIHTGRRGNKYHAVIDLLTPSAYDPRYRSNIEEPAGDDYVFKLVVHEYSTILLDRITQTRKNGGWHFFGAPRWFVDGYEEYLGLMLSSPRNRTEVLAKYLAVHRKDPGRVDFDFGIGVEDAYIDGALLLLFMNETFGKARVQGILTSGERRFGRAMTTELGLGLDEFRKRWEDWLTRRLKGR